MTHAASGQQPPPSPNLSRRQLVWTFIGIAIFTCAILASLTMRQEVADVPVLRWIVLSLGFLGTVCAVVGGFSFVSTQLSERMAYNTSLRTKVEIAIGFLTVLLMATAVVLSVGVQLDVRHEAHTAIAQVIKQFGLTDSDTISVKLIAGDTLKDANAKLLVLSRNLPTYNEIVRNYESAAGGSIPLGLWTPIIAGVLALSLGMLGLKRLESFDKEIRETSAQLKNEVTATLNEMVTNRVKSELETFAETTQNLKNHIENERVSFQSLVDEWKDLIPEKGEFPTISSVQQAHDKSQSTRQTGNNDLAGEILRLVADAEKDLRGDPNDFFNAAMEAFRQNRPDIALAIAKRGLEFFSSNVDLRVTYARALHETGDSDKALAEFDKIESEIPNSRKNWRFASFKEGILRDVGRFDEAIEELEVQKEKTPFDPRPYYEQSISFENTGQLDKAREAIEAAIEKGLIDEGVLRQYASILMALGKHDDAIPHLERALSLSARLQPSTSESIILFTLGNAYETVGRVSDAVIAYLKCIKVEPSSDFAFRANQRLLIIGVDLSQIEDEKSQESSQSTDS